MLHFCESIRMKLTNKALHAFCPKHSQRSFLSQYFDLKHFLVNYNAASILTPPNALKLVTFDQYPEFLRKSEGCRDNSVSTCALLIRSMRYTFDDYSEWVRTSFSSIFGAQAVPLSWPRRSEGEPGDTAGPSGSEPEVPTADSSLSISTVSVWLWFVLAASSAGSYPLPCQLVSEIPQNCWGVPGEEAQMSPWCPCVIMVTSLCSAYGLSSAAARAGLADLPSSLVLHRATGIFT